MSRGYAFRPEAREELREAVRFYEREAKGLGTELAAEVRAVIETIESNPLTGSPFEAGTRRKLLPRFPYSIVYLHEDGQFDVIALMHHRREPGYWSDRVG
ncbi:MAG TPA: type II toxin-antitoxin system RelE/ParE family toxin [Longimicrobium sp.]